MKNVTIKAFVFILASVIMVSCGPGLKVSSDYDRTANFSGYKTYSIYNLKASENVSKLNQDRIEKYIKVEMTKKGFKETSANPDLMVNAFTVLKDKRGIQASTSYYGFGGAYRPYGYWGVPVAGYTSVSTYDYKDGSLLIDVIDARSQKMIWTGTGSAELYKKPKNPEEVISGVVAKIMAEFPASGNN